MLAVHVDPRRFEGWWYEGGGIYRHVWLNAADPVHLAPWGTFVTAQLPDTPPAAGSDRGAACRSRRPSPTRPSRRRGQRSSRRCWTPPGSRRHGDHARHGAGRKEPWKRQQSAVVPRPHRWSLETPYLYRVVSDVERDGQTVDRRLDAASASAPSASTPTAGFFLNGKPVKIQGTCNHQDFAGVGVAVPDSLEYWRVRQLKEMGANAWRMSHNPPTPALLDACDRLGMLVMDENRHVGDSEQQPGRGRQPGPARPQPSQRHHVVDVQRGVRSRAPPEGARIFAAMMETVRRYDTTRPISSAMKRQQDLGQGVLQVEDLQGCNYGGGSDYDRFHAAFPRQPIFGSETASTLTTRGEYADNKERAFVSSYNMTDGSWMPVAERPLDVRLFRLDRL